MKRAVFLQARLASSRLPEKVLLPLAGKSVIEHAMESLARVDVEVHALLTDEESVGRLERPARRCGFEVFAGDPDDVLARFAAAARHWNIDRYFRATGDNPLVSSRLALMLEELHAARGADFSGFLGPPLGTCVELVEAWALFAADREAVDPYEREHVSPFIYRRTDRFRVLRPWAPAAMLMPEARVTLDTVEDYELIKRAYDELYDGKPIETTALVSWLNTQRELNDAPHDLSPLRSTG